MGKLWFTGCALIILVTNVHAQTTHIALLKNNFERAHTAAEKLSGALEICGQAHSLNVDSLYHYASLAKQLAQTAGDRSSEILADTWLENYLIRRNLFDSALILCNADLSHLAYETDRRGYSRTLMEKCYCFSRANRSKEALDLCFRFLGEAEKYADTISQIYIKSLIGIVYRNMQQTGLALHWFLAADSVTLNPAYEQLKNEFGIYFLTGMMYNWAYNDNTDLASRVKDSLRCMNWLDRAISDSRRFENLLILAKALNVKAGVIGNKVNAAKEGEYVTEAAHIYEQLHDTISILNTISPLCFYYIDEGQPERGITACSEGIKIAARSNSYPIIDLYDAMSQCYYAAGNYEKYAETLNDIIRIKDSLYKVNTEKDFAELNARYEDQKKENIIVQQKLDITSKKYSVLLFSALTIILLVAIALLSTYYFRKQRQMKYAQGAAIEAAGESERKRISADLHDNIGAYAAAAASTIPLISASDPQSDDRLHSLGRNVQDMIGQLNDSIWALNKKVVKLTGVSDRIKQFIQKLEYAYPDVTITVRESIEEDWLLSPVHGLNLYRIMQEALNNALRHSGGNYIELTVSSNRKMMEMSIADNGKGISASPKTGHGMGNLEARAIQSGWSFAVEINDTGGTTIAIRGAHTGLL